jgi:hypothetical protein
MNENPEPLAPPQEIPLTPLANQYLDQTRPWAKFMSVMTFIIAAFMVVAAIFIPLMGFGSRFVPVGQERSGPAALVAGIAASFFYILTAVLYLAPGIFLWRYAGAIKLLEMSRSPQALEDAIRSQKSFWKYVGVMTIIGLSFAAVLVVFGLFVAFLLIRK